MTNIGALINKARHARRWSQNRLAAALNEASGHPTLDGQYVSRWERGIRTPDGFWLRYLAQVLHMDLAQLERAAEGASAHDAKLPGAVNLAAALTPRLTTDGRAIFAPSSPVGIANEADATGDMKPASLLATALQTLIDNDDLFGPSIVTSPDETSEGFAASSYDLAERPRDSQPTASAWLAAPQLTEGNEHEALELARRVGASDVGDETLARLEALVDELAVAYPKTPPVVLLNRIRQYLSYVDRLLDARKR